MRRLGPALLALGLVLVMAGSEMAAATHRKKKRTPGPTPTPRPLQGPPAPTPVALLRAAGTCLRFEPGRFLIVAEVGTVGRVFRIDADTKLGVTPAIGSRVRVLYIETADEPLARAVIAGPTEVPTPTRTP